MEEVERAGLSLRAEIYAVLGTLFVSVLSFGVIVAHDASAPGELEAVVTQTAARTCCQRRCSSRRQAQSQTWVVGAGGARPRNA